MACLYSPNLHSNFSGNTHNHIAERRHVRLISLDKGTVSPRYSQPRPFPILFTRGAAHKFARVLTYIGILLWASFYRRNCFSTWEAAFYFSAANYATVGAEGITLQQMWRLIGPLESVVGVLMCGLSASFVFAIVTRLIELREPELVDRRRWEPPLPEVRNQATAVWTEYCRI